VRDNGAGIPEGPRARLFEPFFTSKDVIDGVSGFAIAYFVIVNHHGGSIRCESESGVGTTFHIRLPLHETEEITTHGRERAHSGRG
jgi:signal transduction histidine kinase